MNLSIILGRFDNTKKDKESPALCLFLESIKHIARPKNAYFGWPIVNRFSVNELEECFDKVVTWLDANCPARLVAIDCSLPVFVPDDAYQDVADQMIDEFGRIAKFWQIPIVILLSDSAEAGINRLSTCLHKAAAAAQKKGYAATFVDLDPAKVA